MNRKVMIAGLLAVCVFAMFLLVPMNGASEGSTSYTDSTTGLKYTLNDDGTAIVASNTSATGDVAIPSVINVEGTDYTVTSVVNNAFKGSTLTSISFPDTVTSIGTGVLQNAKQLKTVVIPANLKEIPNNFLRDAEKVESLTIPASVTSIGNYAFYGLKSLPSIEFATGCQVAKIGTNAFQNCTSLKKLTIPNTVNAKNESKIVKISFPTLFLSALVL